MSSKTDALVAKIRNWSIDRHNMLLTKKNEDAAGAIAEEFFEWIYIDENDDTMNIEILSLDKLDK
jgi:hypothetical protein